MIYFLGQLLQASAKELGFLRLVDFISVRSIAAALTAILLTMMLTPVFIRYLHRRRIVDQLRDTGIPSAFDKAGTPIMGGAVMVGSVLVSCLLWCNLANTYLVVALAGMTWFGLIGLVDDLAKLKARSGDRGLSEIGKLALQAAFALMLVGLLASPLTPFPAREAMTFYVPFLKVPLFTFAAGYFVIVFFFVMLVGNAVNITDGMDGLAIVPSIFVLVVLGVFAYVEGNARWANYLLYPRLGGAGELTVFCSAFAGCGHRLPVVQRLPGADLHGRRRLPGHRRQPRDALGAAEAGSALRDSRRTVHRRSAEFADPGQDRHQVARPPDLQPRAVPPPDAARRPGGDQGGHPPLDRVRDSRAGGAGDAEAALSPSWSHVQPDASSPAPLSPHPSFG